MAFNEFQMQNLIDDIQSVDSLNFLDYHIESLVYRFFIACEHGAFDYLSIIIQIMLKYDLITVAAFEDEDYLITLEAVSFNRFGAN